VDKINLDALASIDNQKMRSEVRQALLSLIDSEPTLLSSHENHADLDEVCCFSCELSSVGSESSATAAPGELRCASSGCRCWPAHPG